MTTSPPTPETPTAWERQPNGTYRRYLCTPIDPVACLEARAAGTIAFDANQQSGDILPVTCGCCRQVFTNASARTCLANHGVCDACLPFLEGRATAFPVRRPPTVDEVLAEMDRWGARGVLPENRLDNLTWVEVEALVAGLLIERTTLRALLTEALPAVVRQHDERVSRGNVTRAFCDATEARFEAALGLERGSIAEGTWRSGT